MNRSSPIFGSPFLLGFEHIERLLERTAKAAQEAYPPYNIEHLDERRLRITLALAGFTAEDLSVTVEDNQLVIRGRQMEAQDKSYLHRGIAARQFQRAFVLAEGIDVVAAELRHGLLSIDLQRPEPANVIRRIPVHSGEVQTSGVIDEGKDNKGGSHEPRQ